MDPMSLAGRNIVVTGAAQGIGRAVSDLIIALGGNVVAVDLDEGGLDSLAAEHNERVLSVAGNVSDPSAADLAVERGVKQYGVLHGLVNNAGVTRTATIAKMTQAQWRDVIDVHLTGAFNFLQAFGRHCLERRKAGDHEACSIVNISSDAGRRGTIGQINYGAAKSGMLGLTMSAAREWGKLEIRVNSVCFGVVETQMTEVLRGEKFREQYLAQIPFGRWTRADEAAKPVCFLLSDAASYITGQHLSVNGGYHIGM